MHPQVECPLFSPGATPPERTSRTVPATTTQRNDDEVKTEVKPLAENEVVLEVQVPRDDIRDKVEATLKRLSRELNVPGFRKGHVPRSLVLNRLGKDYVLNETLRDHLGAWYNEALDEADIEPVSQPDIDFGEFSDENDFAFTAKLQLRPKPVLGQYKGLEVPRPAVEVTDAQVDAQLALLQERLATLKPVEGRPVQEGDFLVIDFEGFRDGDPIDGAAAQDYMTQVGRGTLIAGFDEALVGVQGDEEKEFPVTFPDDYGVEDLRGVEATFKVKVKEIKEKIVPELDDDFAKEASEFETLAELRDDVRARLQEAQEAATEREFRAAVIADAVENAAVTLPPAMVERQVDALYHDLEHTVSDQGMTMEAYLAAIEHKPEQVREELRPRAEATLRRSLVIEAIREAEGIEVSDDEVRERIMRDAEILQRDPNQLVIDAYASGRQELVREELMMAKAVDVMVDSAVPVEAEAAETEDEAEAEAAVEVEAEAAVEIEAAVEEPGRLAGDAEGAADTVEMSYAEADVESEASSDEP
jgi:trigger factor